MNTSSEPPSETWRRLVRLAGARPHMAISLAGPGSLDAMIDLCRGGYVRVECANQATCACADELCDALLINGAADEAALAGLIGRTIRLLHDGGVLAVRSRGSRAQRALAASIAAAGFTILGVAHARSGDLAAFTVSRASQKSAA